MSAEEEESTATKAKQADQHNAATRATENAPLEVSARQNTSLADPPEADEFGLPVRPPRRWTWTESAEQEHEDPQNDDLRNGDADTFHDAPEDPSEIPLPQDEDSVPGTQQKVTHKAMASDAAPAVEEVSSIAETDVKVPGGLPAQTLDEDTISATGPEEVDEQGRPRAATLDDIADRPLPEKRASYKRESLGNKRASYGSTGASHKKTNSVSEWSHQVVVPREEVKEEAVEEDEWQEMPAYATHRIHDDWGKVLAKGYGEESDDEQFGYGNLGGAGKGYTRVQVDEDAQSATSMDDNTAYLFKEPHATNALDDDEEGRDAVSQMQTTKELLTEGQRIAYVGVVRLSIKMMHEDIRKLGYNKNTRKLIDLTTASLKMWGQKMMVRLYSHMEIDSAEQLMVEQLSEHGVVASDLTPALMQNARVRNPVKVESARSSTQLPRPASLTSPRPESSADVRSATPNLSRSASPAKAAHPSSSTDSKLPEYFEQKANDMTIEDPEEVGSRKDLDLDIRWTVLCDLFLLLIADSTYDARSRTLLEHVGAALSVSWQEVARFEKRVTDALEMQEQADKENWNEDEHLEARKKAARKKRLMVMGLCTVGGGLVIGLSAGLLAPVIGAGLAAGFTTIGVTGTSTFLGGAGAAAMIGGGGALTGGIVGVRASNRRTGAVRTFEYRPLFNNKRPNLIVTVSGWMTGKVDDVRLPFSTVDPIMGDMYSVHWEPDMLQSTGQTIQILATEALTQTIQQVLGATILTALMAGINIPVVLTKLSYLIDNPWTVSLVRADAAGLILADSLIDRSLGQRPITLVGFSLGSRVIFSCLKELARKGALGLVQNAYLFGSPVIAKKDEYTAARTVVSGRFVNGYATNDWILGYLFRATSGGIMRIAGLNTVDVPGIENRDVTELVPGHMAYRGMMPTLLAEVGWLVDGLEFTDIEDPDPDNHEKRQRELINEIEAARQELEDRQKEKKGGFKSFFSRSKKSTQKKEWETYDERSQKVLEGDEAEVERMAEETGDIMFDVEAIRQEALKLALQGGDIEDIKKHLQIRELESTLPVLRLESPRPSGDASNGRGFPTTKDTSRNGVPRASRSYDSDISRHTDGESTGMNGHAVAPSTKNGSDSREIESRGSLSFEMPERSEIRSTTPTSEGFYRHERPSWNSLASTPSIAPAPAPTPARAPAPVIHDPNHNPWDEDEEFGKEKEMTMSFE